MRTKRRKTQSERIRRFAAKGLFGPVDKSTTVKWAETDQDFLKSFNLLYERYLECNYIKECESFPFHYNCYNLLEKTKKVILEKKAGILSTVDIVMDNTPLGLPMDAIYKEELDALRNEGRRICEVGSLACSRDANWQNTFMPLFRIVFWHARNNGLNDLCIMVNPKHEAFYKSVMVMETLGEEKFYPSVNAPAIALRMNLDHYHETVRNAYQGFPDENSLFNYFFRWEATATRNESRMIRSSSISRMDDNLLSALTIRNQEVRKTMQKINQVNYH